MGKGTGGWAATQTARETGGQKNPLPRCGGTEVASRPPSELFISGLAAEPRKSHLELDRAGGGWGGESWRRWRRRRQVPNHTPTHVQANTEHAPRPPRACGQGHICLSRMRVTHVHSQRYVHCARAHRHTPAHKHAHMKWPKHANTQSRTHTCTHTEGNHRRRTHVYTQEEDTRVHGHGMNISTGTMWSTCLQTQHTCHQTPYTHGGLTLPGTHRAGPACTRMHMATKTCPTNTCRKKTCTDLERVCEQEHTGPHAGDPQVCVCLAVALVLVPGPYPSPPAAHTQSCPTGLQEGSQAPLCPGPHHPAQALQLPARAEPRG